MNETAKITICIYVVTCNLKLMYGYTTVVRYEVLTAVLIVMQLSSDMIQR